MLGNGHDNHRSDLHGLVVGAVPYPVTYLHLWVKNPRARVKIFKLWRQCLDDINFKLFSCRGRVSFIMCHSLYETVKFTATYLKCVSS